MAEKKLTEKHRKNIERMKSIVDGTFGGKIMVGEHSVGRDDEHHEVGDKWTDSDGKEWEQKEGFRAQVSMIKKGIADSCKDCESFIIHKRDKTFYGKFGKCYPCQLNFEAKLMTYPIKWWAWSRLQKLRAWESIDTEALQYFEEKEKLQNKKIYDMSVANALANANVDMTVKKIVLISNLV